mmetsp:Transcript_13812/g.19319  ORF Transcript_13812/g.19319 Transcript_13812/m.19319 type:complete len:87 (+) Transcript_13812:4242-4502(+)
MLLAAANTDSPSGFKSNPTNLICILSIVSFHVRMKSPRGRDQARHSYPTNRARLGLNWGHLNTFGPDTAMDGGPVRAPAIVVTLPW